MLAAGEKHICKKCRPKPIYTEDPRCLKCGKEIDSDEEELCSDCRRLPRSYVQGYPVFNYLPPVSDSVLRIKYSGREEYIPFYAEEIAARFGDTFRDLSADAFVPVPVSRKRLRKRGFNQARKLSDALSAITGIPTADILVREVDTLPQKELDDRERYENLKNAFRVSAEAVPETIIIVDDIYTTGSTIEACTGELLRAGAKKVYYTSICIGKV